MARGNSKGSRTPAPARTRSGAPTRAGGPTLSHALVAASEADPAARGEVLALEHAGEAVVGQLVAGERVGRYGVAGLDGVTSVTDEDGAVVVRFASGATCVVDLEARTIRSDAAGHPSPESVAAIYEALARRGDDPSLSELREALAAYKADRSNLGALVAAAAAGQRALLGTDGFRVIAEQPAPSGKDEKLAVLRDAIEGRGKPYWVERLQRSLPKGVSPIGAVLYPNPQAILAEQAAFTQEQWQPADVVEALEELVNITGQGQELLDRARKAGDNKDELQKIADQFPYEQSLGTPGPITLAVRRRTAKDLGLRLYQSNPDFVWDTTMSEAALNMSNDMSVGVRSFGLAGPPGTGKNSFIYEYAATTGQGVFEVDMSASDTLRDMIGDVGIKDGDTVLNIGPLSKALCAPGGCVAVFNEAVSIRGDEQTAFHNILGSGLDQRRNRFITYKSHEQAPEGADIPREIDPDSVCFVTWNPGRADERPNEAVLRRLSTYTMEYGTEEEETEKMAKIVYPIVSRHLLASEDPEVVERWTYDPELTKELDGEEVPVPLTEQCPDLAAECKRGVQLASHLREMYREDAVRQYMDTTTLGRFIASVVIEESPSAVRLAARKLDFMFDQSEAPEDRFDQLVEAMTDIYGDRISGADTGGI